jgi:hypothetical protein
MDGDGNGHRPARVSDFVATLRRRAAAAEVPTHGMTQMEVWLVDKAAETVARLARETGMGLDEALAVVAERLRTDGSDGGAGS